MISLKRSCTPVHGKGPPVQEEGDVRGSHVGVDELCLVGEIAYVGQLPASDVAHHQLQATPE
jgi:hypothetical protein